MTSNKKRTSYLMVASLDAGFLRKYEEIWECIIFTTVSVDLLSFSYYCSVVVQFNQP